MKYTYKCKKCGAVFETQHSMTEDPELPCPECNGETRRVISDTPVIYKIETTRGRKRLKGE